MQTFFITGTSRGLGRALAMHLLDDPAAHVIGLARTCSITHERYQHESIDLTNLYAVQNSQFQLDEQTNRATLINNAGSIHPIAPVGRLDGPALIDNLAINLISPALLMNNFIRDTEKLNIPRLIINISSGAGRKPVDAWSVYCAGKAGLDMFSRVVHTEQPLYGTRHPVRIFSIAPGVVDTAMQQQIRSVASQNFANRDRFIQMQRNGGLASAEATAQAIAKIVADPDAYASVCLDVRELSLK